MVERMLKEKNMSIYQCSKSSGIPYTTLLEIVRGKTSITKCSAEVVYKLSKVLNVSMEALIQDTLEPRMDFEVFKSNICHLVKDGNEIDFIVATLQNDQIRKYWNKKWYAEAFYILAMVDYLSRINEIPLCTRYNDIRSHSLKDILYPRDILLMAKLHPSLDVRKQCIQEAIPEFLRFNIVEREIRNVY